jgi:hypothetical protein
MIASCVDTSLTQFRSACTASGQVSDHHDGLSLDLWAAVDAQQAVEGHGFGVTVTGLGPAALLQTIVPQGTWFVTAKASHSICILVKFQFIFVSLAAECSCWLRTQPIRLHTQPPE